MSAAPGRPAQMLCILWPAFLMAGVLETLVFAVVDPSNLQWFGASPVDLQPTTVYSVAFLLFWLIISIASGLTQFLANPQAQ
jgi:hypothetical protein